MTMCLTCSQPDSRPKNLGPVAPQTSYVSDPEATPGDLLSDPEAAPGDHVRDPEV